MNLDGNFEIPQRVALTFTLLMLAFWLYQQSLSGWTDWTKIFNPVQPSLQASPSPADRLSVGTLGCIASIIYRGLMWLILLTAADTLFFENKGITTVLANLPLWVERTTSFLENVLQRVLY